MSEQLPLIAAPPKLRPRQQALYDLVRAHPEGITKDEAGALIHSLKGGRWAHPASERCDWCARDGRQALSSKALKPLLVGRRDGRWYLRDASDYERAPAGIVSHHVPGDPFADLYADPARLNSPQEAAK